MATGQQTVVMAYAVKRVLGDKAGMLLQMMSFVVPYNLLKPPQLRSQKDAVGQTGDELTDSHLFPGKKEGPLSGTTPAETHLLLHTSTLPLSTVDPLLK